MIWLILGGISVYLTVGVTMIPTMARTKAKGSLEMLLPEQGQYELYRNPHVKERAEIAWGSAWSGLFWPLAGAYLMAQRSVDKVVEEHLALDRAREILAEEKRREVEILEAEKDRFDAEIKAAERQAELDRRKRDLATRELAEVNRSKQLEIRAAEVEIRAAELKLQESEALERKKAREERERIRAEREKEIATVKATAGPATRRKKPTLKTE